MVRLFLGFFIGFFSVLQAEHFEWFDSLTPKAQRAQEIMKEFEPVVDQALVDFKVPGMAVGLVVDGELVYAKGFGYRDFDAKLPVTNETLFAIGSCTKAFTSFLVGNCVDEGLLNWDTPLIETIPELHLWDYDATYHLTFRDILTHRSGLPRHDFLWYNAKIDQKTLLKKLKYLDPVCHIKQRYIYNNLMYWLAGVGVEKLLGKRWEELVLEKILKPLNMNKTNFSVAESQQFHDCAVPYLEKNNQLHKVPFRDFSLVGPSASMNSNVEDLSQWLKMLLNRGSYKNRQLIQSATLEEILLPQVITTGTPEAQDTTFSAYGIGWSIHSYRGHYFISHDGISDGFTSVVGFLPRENIGIIVMVNKNLTALPRFVSLQMLDRILNLPTIDWIRQGLEGLQKTKIADLEKKGKEDPTRKLGTMPSHAIEDFVGEYEHPGYGTLLVDLFEGKLRVLFNEIPYILDHWHYDVFAITEEPETGIISLEGTKFTFRSDVNGEISEVAFPFEPSVKDIVFRRKPDLARSSVEYLRRFTGNYEIYGYTVDVSIQGGVLCAIIPGQPVYQLIPNGENEFRVKSKTSYLVRFVLNGNGAVEEVLLMQPYGTFSAKPRK